jgi:hypothetical protein
MSRILLAAVVGGVTAALITVICMALGASESVIRIAPALSVPIAMAVAQVGRKPKAAPPAVQATTQIAGANCVACQQKIVLAFEGVACDRCRAPLHRQCQPRHSC